MPIRKFYIKGDGKVIDVGLRPSLVSIGLSYDVKVATRNLYEENKVEVIVSGTDESIHQFYERVKKEDIRAVRDEKAYTITELEPYEGIEPEWAYHMSASVMEQIYKGVSRIAGMEERLRALDGIQGTLRGIQETLSGIRGTLNGVQGTLRGIDRKFGEMMDRFGVFSEYAKALAERIDALPEKIAEALRKNSHKTPNLS